MNKKNNIVSFTDLNFQKEVVHSQQVVLVLFETEWFGGTHILMPVIQYLAEKFTGKLKVGKIDMDTNELIPKEYGIADTITILLFKDGEIKDRISGMVDRETLEEKVVALI